MYVYVCACVSYHCFKQRFSNSTAYLNHLERFKGHPLTILVPWDSKVWSREPLQPFLCCLVLWGHHSPKKMDGLGAVVQRPTCWGKLGGALSAQVPVQLAPKQTWSQDCEVCTPGDKLCNPWVLISHGCPVVSLWPHSPLLIVETDRSPTP